jgi:peptide subunit release factor 1 (eRF1)
LANRVSGTLGIELFASEAEILRAAMVAAEAAERAQELADVLAVKDRATPYAVTGFENTLAALHERRVDRLLIAARIPASVRKCTECGRMTAMERCPLCAGMTLAEDDLPTSAIRAAMEQGASVDVVSGDAAGELMRVGGLAAWCRRSDRS